MKYITEIILFVAMRQLFRNDHTPCFRERFILID